MTDIIVDKKIPNFEALATSNIHFNLKEYLGQPIFLYFYPRDNTPGCTQEGQYFRDNFAQFQAKNVLVLGISRDSLKVHENFKAKHEFPFNLISDKEEQLCQLFDVIKEKKLYGKTHMGIERSSFLINADGVLVKEWRKVKVKDHLEQVLEAINTL